MQPAEKCLLENRFSGAIVADDVHSPAHAVIDFFMLKTIAALGLYLIYISFLVVNWMEHPAYNWDMYAYVGAAISYEEEDITKLHRETYRSVKEVIPPAKYKNSNKFKHNRIMSERADFFTAKLNGYHIKPLYVAGVYALNKLGMNLVFSTRLLAIIPAVGLAVLMLIWFCRYYTIGYACLLSSLMAISAGLSSVSLYSTPDVLSAFLLVLGVYFLLERQCIRTGGAILIMSIFARVDNVILVNLIFFSLTFFASRSERLTLVQFGLFSLAATACYLAIGYFAQADSWATMFHHAFAQLIIDPADKVYSITPSFYLETLATQLSVFFVFGAFAQACFFVCMGVVTVLLHRNHIAYKTSPLLAGLAIGVLAAMVIRYLAFPLLEGRYYIGNYLILSLLFFRQLAEATFPVGGSAESPNIAATNSRTPFIFEIFRNR